MRHWTRLGWLYAEARTLQHPPPPWPARAEHLKTRGGLDTIMAAKWHFALPFNREKHSKKSCESPFCLFTTRRLRNFFFYNNSIPLHNPPQHGSYQQTHGSDSAALTKQMICLLCSDHAAGSDSEGTAAGATAAHLSSASLNFPCTSLKSVNRNDDCVLPSSQFPHVPLRTSFSSFSVRPST